MADIQKIAAQLVANDKGILAADESTNTIEKRFEKINLQNSEENRRIYRELLFTAPDIEKYISGVIMFEETLYQRTGDGRRFVDVLNEKGIIPGIKVDKGKEELANFPGEEVTVGIDDLRARLAEYKNQGAVFAKWRAVVSIGSGTPSKGAIHANMHLLARYAALVQEAGMVPIVEPEVLMDGSHDIEECEIVTGICLDELFEELFVNKVDLKGILLKPNMVLPGAEATGELATEEIAEATLRVLKKSVPKDVPGIVFLSGGQKASDATRNLCELNRVKKQPWALSFSFGRALQDDTLVAWGGNGDNWQSAQKVFYETAKADAEANRGEC